MKPQQIIGLYYITHVNNVVSILEHGILSHEKIESEGIQYTRIYDEGIVANRHNICTPDGRSLWAFTNLYFQPRNAMLYRVLHEKSDRDIAIISVKPEILDRLDIYITTGNAAHSSSEILSSGDGRKRLRKIFQDTRIEFWKEEDGSKRKIMAECLIPDKVPSDFIQGVYVATHEAKASLEAAIPRLTVQVISEPHWFFRPSWVSYLTPRLLLAEGDMFFSKAQTLTVSVNTVGVMGKGLASRAKYQFPDVYVYYQDLCRKHKWTMGKPYLYKRQS